MKKDVRRRLRELGVVKGARQLATLPQPRRVAIEDLVPGRFHTTSRGRCFVVQETYPLDHPHGDLPLGSYHQVVPEIVAHLGQDDALAEVDLKQACFLDTETTGLSGGTGTMAFVVGLGFFSGDDFCLHQYFLRDPGDEPAMVEVLAEQLATFQALVSFNGRAFDVPILDNRFILARIPPPTDLPHLDLLFPARRLWRYGLSSCALGSLERGVLGVQREQDDVPGGEIPYLYRDYLRTGDAREMKRVIYHNAVDILSLVTLTALLGRIVGDPWSEESLGGAEFYGLGRWYASLDRPAEVERAYRAALERSRGMAQELRLKTLHDLALFLKRADRRPEAYAFWQQLALETDDDVQAHVELAKHLEWHAQNLPLAVRWIEAAVARAEAWPAGLRRQDALAALQHRLARLERKLRDAQEEPPNDA